MKVLLDLSGHAKTFGSLIQVPASIAERIPEIEQKVRQVAGRTSEIVSLTALAFLPVVLQAKMLAGRYDCVVANPPYMGGKYFNTMLKAFVGKHYKHAKSDLYACFIQRNIAFTKSNGLVGMITIPNWMFLSSFEGVRKGIFADQTIETFIHNGRGVFGSDFGSCSFVLRNQALPLYLGVFRKLFERQGSVAGVDDLERRFFEAENYLASPNDFKKLPGEVIAYWISDRDRSAFSENDPLVEYAQPRQGLATADDGRFLRLWHEVSLGNINFEASNASEASESPQRWFPFHKGGSFRKWYGNQEYVVDWEDDGRRLKEFRPRSVIRNEDYYFQPGITWSRISISKPSFRYFGKGFIIGDKGPGIYCRPASIWDVLAYLNSRAVLKFLEMLSPAVGFEIGQIKDLPFKESGPRASEIAKRLVEMHREDWDSAENSWSFQRNPLLECDGEGSVRAALERWVDFRTERHSLAMRLEEENNRIFIQAFDLQDEASPEVAPNEITLDRPDRAEEIKRLISYAIGCMMGRYSLDTPGLIYAHGGNTGFDPAEYYTFSADSDGIVPVMEADWFDDDAANRFVEFLGVAWPREGLDENLKFVADALGPSRGDQPRDTIRQYIAAGFYKHHLQTYQRRPIYWLFSSGKLRAFQCLVYLHRYHEGTLARMRTEYVIPLQGRLASRIDQLAGDIPKATSTSHRTTLTKERDKLIKQQAELQAYDEKLRHYADMRITLDLDDGVAANYARLGDLLADLNLKGKIAYISNEFDEPVQDFQE